MTKSPNLDMPYILPAQAQKHVTHNQSIQLLDTLTQLSVTARSVSSPPVSPVNGERYILSSTPSGAWENQAHTLAVFEDSYWVFLTPKLGWRAWVIDEQALVVWDGSAWVNAQSEPSFQNLISLGINSSADTTNRLSINAPATLLNNDGAGHQLKINKNATSDTASLLMQSQFTGHAEMGLSGDNDFHVKVSTDGSDWHDAITTDGNTGCVTVPALKSGTITINSDSTATISTPHSGGFVLILLTSVSYPQSDCSGIFVYDTGPSLKLNTLVTGTQLTSLGTTALTGTSGTAGKASISVASSAIVIENRYSSARQFSYTFLG